MLWVLNEHHTCRCTGNTLFLQCVNGHFTEANQEFLTLSKLTEVELLNMQQVIMDTTILDNGIVAWLARKTHS